VGDDPDIVFEHPGRSDHGRERLRRQAGGTIVTCAATSGYMIEYDNRHLWMKLKTIKGSHFANYREAWAANQTISTARSCRRCRPSSPRRGGRGAYQVHHNRTRARSGPVRRAARGPRRHRPRTARAVGEDGSRSFARHMTRSRHVTHCSPRSTTSPSPCNDLDAAIAWYEVGLRGHGRPPRGRPLRRGRRGAHSRSPTPTSSCSHRRATTRRSPSTSEKKGEASTTSAYRVDDCAAALEAVKAAGGG
jgi:hypothetical protein